MQSGNKVRGAQNRAQNRPLGLILNRGTKDKATKLAHQSSKGKGSTPDKRYELFT